VDADDPDDCDEEAGEGAGGPGPPVVFGLEARPWSCGGVGAILFALLVGPILLTFLGPDDWNCGPESLACTPAKGIFWTREALVAIAASAAVYGLLVARLVARWPFRRPPLWAALVGMTLLALMAAPWLALLAGMTLRRSEINVDHHLLSGAKAPTLFHASRGWPGLPIMRNSA